MLKGLLERKKVLVLTIHTINAEDITFCWREILRVTIVIPEQEEWVWI